MMHFMAIEVPTVRPAPMPDVPTQPAQEEAQRPTRPRRQRRANTRVHGPEWV
jgi:hypothetical protein